jgi:Flp pilus assembly protein protease CpaA
MPLVRSRLTRWQRLSMVPIGLLMLAGLTYLRSDPPFALWMIRAVALPYGIAAAVTVLAMYGIARILQKVSHAK